MYLTRISMFCLCSLLLTSSLSWAYPGLHESPPRPPASQADWESFLIWLNSLENYLDVQKDWHAAAAAEIAALERKIAVLEGSGAQALSPYVSVQTGAVNGLAGPHIVFTGANVHIRSGSGATREAAPVGKGNLIVGYNEKPVRREWVADANGQETRLASDPANSGSLLEESGYYRELPGEVLAASDRGGSHNLIVGPRHIYASSGGFVAGYDNALRDDYASVSGGRDNTASGEAASVSGGWDNTASGELASISGGWDNTASGDWSSVGGGWDNLAGGDIASVGGGWDNTASGEAASVGGGWDNLAGGELATISGGRNNEASGDWSSVSGGWDNLAGGDVATISGGRDNEASGDWSSVGGGWDNLAGGDVASIIGGRDNEASGDWSSVSGGRDNEASGTTASVSGGSSVEADESNAWSGGGLLHDLTAYISVETGKVNGLAGPHIVFTGANVHIRSGSAATIEATPVGKGNLVVGYNEVPTEPEWVPDPNGEETHLVPDPENPGNKIRQRGYWTQVNALETGDRGGSHNLIVGPRHIYDSTGGFVAGYRNALLNDSASVSGGRNNEASGHYASVSGGGANEASGEAASVSGGGANEASGYSASVSGGWANTASGIGASASGGGRNFASGLYVSVIGGWENRASGSHASVSGGRANTASGDHASVSGGRGNTASGSYGSVSGGRHNTAGGVRHADNPSATSVSGGQNRTASGQYDWRAGGAFQDK